MPQLQVVNTGGNFMNTALGNISEGFINSFNQRAEQSRNDEIFSRIKSKYGPNVDADTLYKDVLQSSGFDQSYKKDTLGMIKQLAALEHDKDKTNYDKIRLEQYETDLGIRTRNATTGEQNAKNRAKQLQISEQRLIDARDKPSKNMPKLFSDYTNQALKNTTFQPEDKAFIDSLGVRLLKENKDNPDYTPADAFQEAYQANVTRKDILDKSTPPPAPDSTFDYVTASWKPPSPEQTAKAVNDLFQYLKSAYDAGITSQKDLLTLAKKGKWSAEDANKVIQKVLQKPQSVLDRPTQDQVNALF